MKACTFILSLFIAVNFSFSQDYYSAIGVKGGYPGVTGLNYKRYLGKIKPKFALDQSLMANFDRDNRFLYYQPLIEFNKGFGMNQGYNWYAGVGPEILYYVNGGYLSKSGEGRSDKLFLKADAIFGLEYTAPLTRINAAIEGGLSTYVYPIVELGALVNISVRYVLER